MDGYIETGRFCEFVDSLVDIHNEEKREQYNWEFFLHKVFDMTYTDFEENIRNNEAAQKSQNMSVETIETTIQDSMNILNNFKPKEGGE